MHPATLLSMTLLLLTVHLTLATPTPAPGDAPGKRQCDQDCRCAKGIKPGMYCWGCGAVTYPGDLSGVEGDYRNRVFECGTEEQDCCMYGEIKECSGGGAGLCSW
ncbi:hypothetical protein P167DRAFT_540766 [Morchella conica CCBAS932]|uniref:Uncharacterized protein n=1 Tax=Morchella conica CCBAS932 TaxID=1392247 RepID=A0A3N4KL09_9PEZI|nr:hypothetical protein P167DRAFT_540766 [Morchella conica CCBAS932]